MDTTAIKNGFDRSANTYDQARRQLVPGFDDFYGAAVACLRFQPRDAFRVLDLGAGTGLLSWLISERFTQARFTLLDLSEAMLAQAQARFASAPERFTFVAADYSESLAGQYDVVVSALSIHHLTDACKQTLFQRVYTLLPTGGMFMNADQILGATPDIEKSYRDTWMEQVRRAGISEVDLTAALERMREDQSATLDAQLAWLREAGFGEVKCWYQEGRFAVFSGLKR
ncbi:class I SAM-dependent methyltransferase [Thiocystis violascens]|uniref:Methylase involved in ubiquinone/menaquinone biosynthesis n=1 Tax=Thiocystis violascens (strain ATCC 17096 / DSM 198 / 6111) TaxID=765911 RepID=I3Y821_THIV6|nr:class I SAM-dependent methyltransferase [Thiocystis violascens]AFL73139.1 methylase involved in ubiquinone/menaquinone biosynthesis [Thiocystis violascens DSM 198]